jgi:hypothetical protein
MDSVWIGRRDTDKIAQNNFFGATPIKGASINPLPKQDASACISTGKGLWKDKIYHFLPDKEPSANGNEIQSEYFIKYENYVDALNALYQIRE